MNNKSPWNNTSSSTLQGSQVQCQICAKNGHTAIDYWHRCDHNSQTNISVNPSHTFSPVRDNNEPSLLGTPSTLHDPPHIEIVVHHITHDNTNLSTKNTYFDSEIVKIDNGTGLSIHHVGNVVYTLPQVSLKQL